MTDPAGDFDLGSFEGDPISRATIKVTGAGDGLSEAMKIDARKLHLDDEVYIVMRCVVAGVSHEPIIQKGDRVGTSRVHKLKANEAVIVEDQHVQELLANHAEQVAMMKEQERLARERARGVHSFDDAELLTAHAEGEHDAMPIPDDCEACARAADFDPEGADSPEPVDA